MSKRSIAQTGRRAPSSPSKCSERGMSMGPANMDVQGYLRSWGTAHAGFGREANDGSHSPRCVKPKGVWMVGAIQRAEPARG